MTAPEGRWYWKQNLDDSYSVTKPGESLVPVHYFICGDEESAQIATDNLNALEAEAAALRVKAESYERALREIVRWADENEEGTAYIHDTAFFALRDGAKNALRDLG